jgi:hypothetical protein
LTNKYWNTLIGGSERKVTPHPIPTYSIDYLKLIVGIDNLETTEQKIKELND